MPKLVELTSRLDTTEVQEPLFHLVGCRDDEALNQAALSEAVSQYRTVNTLGI